MRADRAHVRGSKKENVLDAPPALSRVLFTARAVPGRLVTH
jgi:hypothetical protein